MDVPVLLYGSKEWTMKSRDDSRLQTAEIRFLKVVRRCTRPSQKRRHYKSTESEINNTKSNQLYRELEIYKKNASQKKAKASIEISGK
jgi:hypothetical protein